MLHALVGTRPGKQKAVQASVRILPPLLQLLPMSSPRIQRSILGVLRRLLPQVPPSGLDAAVKVPFECLPETMAKDAMRGVDAESPLPPMEPEAAARPTAGRGGIVVALLLLVAKAFEMQVRGKAGGRSISGKALMSDRLGVIGAVDSGVARGLVRLLRELWVRDAGAGASADAVTELEAAADAATDAAQATKAA